jgi:hypothetical protein
MCGTFISTGITTVTTVKIIKRRTRVLRVTFLTQTTILHFQQTERTIRVKSIEIICRELWFIFFRETLRGDKKVKAVPCDAHRILIRNKRYT